MVNMSRKEEYKKLVDQARNDISPKDRDFIDKFTSMYKEQLEWLKDN